LIINAGLTSNDTTSVDFQNLVNEVMLPIAPKDLTAVTFTHAGSAVEKAIMNAMAERGQGNWTAVTFTGSYKSVPSFALQQYHGENNKWGQVDYPKNEHEDSSILDKVKSALREGRSGNKPVAALVVQPV
jgi:hypothetical protein